MAKYKSQSSKSITRKFGYIFMIATFAHLPAFYQYFGSEQSVLISKLSATTESSLVTSIFLLSPVLAHYVSEFADLNYHYHTISSVLLFLVIRKILSDQRFDRNICDNSAALAASIFSIHPLSLCAIKSGSPVATLQLLIVLTGLLTYLRMDWSNNFLKSVPKAILAAFALSENIFGSLLLVFLDMTTNFSLVPISLVGVKLLYSSQSVYETVRNHLNSKSIVRVASETVKACLSFARGEYGPSIDNIAMQMSTDTIVNLEPLELFNANKTLAYEYGGYSGVGIDDQTMQMSTVCVENLEPWELFTANRSSPDAATIGTATSSLAVDIGTLTTSREEMEFAVLVTVVGVCAVIAVVCLYSRGRVFDGVKALFAWIVLNTVNVATGQKTQFCGYSSCCFVCFIGGIGLAQAWTAPTLPHVVQQGENGYGQCIATTSLVVKLSPGRKLCYPAPLQFSVWASMAFQGAGALFCVFGLMTHFRH